MQMMGLQFGLVGGLQRLYVSTVLGAVAGQHTDLEFVDEVAVATGGGMISAIFSCPFELVMIQQQRFGGSIASTVGGIVKRFGMFGSGMGRAMSICVVRDGIYTAGLLGITPATQTELMKQGHSQSAAGLYASVIGGVTCAFFSHPLDVCKTCMQGDLERKTYKTTSETFHRLMAEGGTRRLFSGLFWRSFNIVGTIYIANEVRIRANRFLIDRKHRA